MRYREMRWPCEFPVTVLRGGLRLQATIINVSAGGVRLSMERGLPQGEVVILDIGPRQVAGTVRWVRAGLCGLRLLTPLSKEELGLVRRGRTALDATGAGRWNTHLREMR